MALELRKVKVHEDMSEETTCFSAEMWEDGVKIGYVKNDGRGGCDHISPTEGNGAKARKYEENFTVEFNRENQPISFLLNDHMVATDNQAKGLVFRKGGTEEYYTIGIGNGMSIAQVQKHPKGMETIKTIWLREKSNGSTLLNRNIKL